MMIWLKKVDHCTLKKIIIFLKVSMKKKKTIIKFDDTEIQKRKFDKHITHFNKNVNINKIVVSNKVSFGKRGFKYFIGCKDLCVYFSPKWVHIVKTLMKLCMYLFK